MFTHPIYLALKEEIKHIAPVFNYKGQYLQGKGNQSYIVPAIYIEMPKNTPVTYSGRGRKIMKPAQIKIHYISNAPYSGHDNVIQEAALQQHSAALTAIDDKTQGKVFFRPDQNIRTQKMRQTAANEFNYLEGHVYSILTYTTEIYN